MLRGRKMLNQLFTLLLTSFNWTNFSENFNEFWMTPYKLYLNEAFWPVIFTSVFGLSFVISKGNIAVTAAAVLFTFGVFGSTEAFKDSPEFSLLFGLVAIACFAGTVAMIFTKRSNH